MFTGEDENFVFTATFSVIHAGTKGERRRGEKKGKGRAGEERVEEERVGEEIFIGTITVFLPSGGIIHYW